MKNLLVLGFNFYVFRGIDWIRFLKFFVVINFFRFGDFLDFIYIYRIRMSNVVFIFFFVIVVRLIG